MDRREAEELAMALAIVAAVALVAFAPIDGGVLADLAPDLSGLEGASGPVLLGVGLVLSAAVTLAVAALVVRYGAGAGGRAVGRVHGLYRAVVPDTPLGTAAVGFTFAIVVVIAVVGGLPSMVGDLASAQNSPAGFADRLSDRAMNTEWDDILDGDAVRGGGCPAGEDAGPPEPESDADGDGLADAWELREETPGGTPLPGADPGRKDLYVQVNYGSGTDPLTDAEKEQLRTAWAEMPVDNPDGTQGISIHLDDESAGAGNLGERAVFESAEGTTRYYTTERLGERACVYNQVTYGDFQMGRTVGYGESPGYASIVDGSRQPDYEGTVSFRVGVTVHELLHNVAGHVDGEPHTAEGWLAGGPNDEFLSNATAAELNGDGLRDAAT